MDLYNNEILTYSVTMESFFNKMKVEIGDLKQYRSANTLIQAINTWIKYYNLSRIQMKLGGK